MFLFTVLWLIVAQDIITNGNDVDFETAGVAGKAYMHSFIYFALQVTDCDRRKQVGDDGDDLGETHEINVTPFIDVMLVLLIIFMVAAPLATVDIKVDLPASSAKPAPRPEKPIFLSVKADQRLFLGEEEVRSIAPCRSEGAPSLPGGTTLSASS